jgi:hypothetical protein
VYSIMEGMKADAECVSPLDERMAYWYRSRAEAIGDVMRVVRAAITGEGRARSARRGRGVGNA